MGQAGCCATAVPRGASGADSPFQKAEANSISWSPRLVMLGEALLKWGTEILLPPA